MTDTYWTVLDPIPQQYEDQNRLAPFYENLREDRFVTTCCRACGAVHWPPRSVCPECMSDDLSWEDMPARGTIYRYTVQVAGVPAGFQPPLVYALVDFDNGIRLFTAIVDCAPEDVAAGSEVEVVVQEVAPDQDGRRRVLPYFRLAA